MINSVESAQCMTHDGSFFASLILTMRTVFWYTSRTTEGLAMISHLLVPAYTRKDLQTPAHETPHHEQRTHLYHKGHRNTIIEGVQLQRGRNFKAIKCLTLLTLLQLTDWGQPILCIISHNTFIPSAGMNSCKFDTKCNTVPKMPVNS